jgi:hypothetical protein
MAPIHWMPTATTTACLTATKWSRAVTRTTSRMGATRRPLATMSWRLDLQVGDPQRLANLSVGSLTVGTIRHKGKLGALTPPRTYKFRRGRLYEVTLQHLGSKRSTPDLDWTARVTSIASGVTVVDSGDLLGTHNDETGYNGVSWLVINAPCDFTGKEDVDIRVQDAAVTGDAGTWLANAKECTIGAQTFVNLDNDDEDETFDIDDTDGVANDNELVPLEVKINSSLPDGKVSISGGSTVRFWRDANKTTEFLPSTQLIHPEDFASGLRLWAEGIAPDTATRGTSIQATYVADDDPAITLSDSVALTVLGIESVTWVGRENAVDDGNTLDADPNWPPGMITGAGEPLAAQRVFPDARYVAGTIEPGARQFVDARVTLTAPPAKPVIVYLRSFDVDDPFSAVAPLDNESVDDDNRGTTPARVGELVGVKAATGVADLFLSAQSAGIGFMTTMQPGDNFRVVASADSAFLQQLEHVDSALGADESDKQRIINTHIGAGSVADREIREPAHYASPVLTVWRHLHLEIDSMAPVANNFLAVEVRMFDTDHSDAAIEWQVTGSVTLDDGSPNLDSSPSGNGRFEAGRVEVAGGTHEIDSLDGSGNVRIVRASGLDLCAAPLPFSAANGTGTNTMYGTVTHVEKVSTQFLLHVNITGYSGTEPADWTSWLGSSAASIDGGTGMTIIAADKANGRIVTGILRVPIVLFDDDPDAGTTIPPIETGRMADAFARAYILPVAGVLPGDEMLSFRSNILRSTGLITQGWSFTNEANHDLPRFWLVYLRRAFQGDSAEDVDPDDEGSTWGEADDVATPTTRARGADIYWQPHPETVLWPTPHVRDSTGAMRGYLEVDTVVHEIGHLFGCTHREAGIMGDGRFSLFNSIDFSDESLDRIRSCSSP